MVKFGISYIIVYAIKTVKKVPGYSLFKAYQIFGSDYPRFMMYYQEIYNQQLNIETLNETVNVATQKRIIERVREGISRIYRAIRSDLKEELEYYEESRIDVDVKYLNWQIGLSTTQRTEHVYDYENPGYEYTDTIPEVDDNGNLTGKYVEETFWSGPPIIGDSQKIYYTLNAWSIKQHDKYINVMTESRKELQRNVNLLARTIAIEQTINNNTGALITAILLGL